MDVAEIIRVELQVGTEDSAETWIKRLASSATFVIVSGDQTIDDNGTKWIMNGSIGLC